MIQEKTWKEDFVSRESLIQNQKLYYEEEQFNSRTKLQGYYNRHYCLKCSKIYFIKSDDFKCPYWIDWVTELIICDGIQVEIDEDKYSELQEKEDFDGYEEDF